VVEGARLESGYTVMNRIVSSNLIPSAIAQDYIFDVVGLFGLIF
jgi:hypothetical protein